MLWMFAPAMLNAQTEQALLQKAMENPVFQVKGTAVNSLFMNGDEIKSNKDNDQVIYEIDLPQKTVKRIALYNPRIKEGPNAGLQADGAVYNIVQYDHDFMKDQLIIKAIGQAGESDTFETLIIGEDFITTSRSTKGYFVLYHYDRTDSDGIHFREKRLKAKERVTHDLW